MLPFTPRGINHTCVYPNGVSIKVKDLPSQIWWGSGSDRNTCSIHTLTPYNINHFLIVGKKVIRVRESLQITIHYYDTHTQSLIINLK